LRALWLPASDGRGRSMRPIWAVLIVLALLAAGCSLAEDITPPPGLEVGCVPIVTRQEATAATQ